MPVGLLKGKIHIMCELLNSIALLHLPGDCLERPTVTVNCAASIDGKISTAKRRRVALSDKSDLARVRELRKTHDAIAVGIGTVLADDPALAAEVRNGQKPPARIVFDSSGRTPGGSKVLSGQGRTYIITTESCSRKVPGATMIRCGRKRVDMRKALNLLYSEGIKSVLVEGGGEVIFELARLHLIDRLSIYVAPVLIGGRKAPTIADGGGFTDEKEFERFRLKAVNVLGEGLLMEYDRTVD